MLLILELLGAGVPVGLLGAVTAVLVLEFALSAVVQAAQRVVTESKSRKAIVRRIEVSPV